MEKDLRKKLKNGRFENVPPKRSKTMSSIRGKGNKTTEVKFRLMLVRAGMRGWKLHPRGITGNPDFFFPQSQVAVFLDGCFWHGCPKCGHVPKTNSGFWKAKIQKNRARDRKNRAKLTKEGVRVVRFWEHELKTSPKRCIGKLGRNLLKGESEEAENIVIENPA